MLRFASVVSLSCGFTKEQKNKHLEEHLSLYRASLTAGKLSVHPKQKLSDLLLVVSSQANSLGFICQGFELICLPPP